MNTKLYVGNLSFTITQKDLQDLFAQHGPVEEVNLVMDRVTGRPRGFGFVTMATPEAAQAAMQALHGRNYEGRNLTVKEARSQEGRSERSPGGDQGGRGDYGHRQ